MSIDVHPDSAPYEAGTPAAADDLDTPWSETAVTVIGATVTIGFVSLVAVLMALA